MKNKILFILLSLVLFISNVNALEIESNNAILYNLNTNEIIYEKDSEEVIKIASLTKIMTAIVALENIDDINKEVVITYDMIKGLIEANALVVGFRVGDVVTYEDLLYALMLPSAADAAQALAISISNDAFSFIQLMNEKAKELGLENTKFTNATGLDYKDNHSTVKEVAELLQYALKNETFKKIYETRYYNKNGLKLMSSLEKNAKQYNLDVDYIKGAKTGYTNLAGLCLSSITSYNGIDYLLITAGADHTLKKPLNIIDSDKIYKYYFENYEKRNLLIKNDKLLSIDNKYSDSDINIVANEDYSLYLLKEDYNNVRYEYVGLNEINIFTKEDIVGKYNVILNNEIIKSIDIYKPQNIDFSVLLFINNYLYIIIPCILTIILIILLIILIRRSYGNKNNSRRDVTS